jgi:hypothetical protein
VSAYYNSKVRHHESSDAALCDEESIFNVRGALAAQGARLGNVVIQNMLLRNKDYEEFIFGRPYEVPSNTVRQLLAYKERIRHICHGEATKDEFPTLSDMLGVCQMRNWHTFNWYRAWVWVSAAMADIRGTLAELKRHNIPWENARGDGSFRGIDCICSSLETTYTLEMSGWPVLGALCWLFTECGPEPGEWRPLWFLLIKSMRDYYTNTSCRDAASNLLYAQVRLGLVQLLCMF